MGNSDRGSGIDNCGTGTADPCVSANLYLSGNLDAVVRSVLLPAWSTFRKAAAGGEGEKAFVWILRYSRGGEHLKVRWHGPGSSSDVWKRILEDAWNLYLEKFPPSESADREVSLTATPIDLEDQTATAYADRTLLWTSYRRSHVSLGYRPYVDDEEFVRRLVASLGCSTEILLASLQGDEGKPAGKADFQARQNLFIRAVASALAGLPFTDSKRSTFLLYQRDILLRLHRRRKNVKGYFLNLVLERFTQRILQIEQGGRRLSDQALQYWRQGPAPSWSAPHLAWAQSIAWLHRHVAAVCGDLEHQIDPFAESADFPPLFKAFHGFANQLGLQTLDEAFVYHFLLHFTADDAHRSNPVQLRPRL